jgi:hypothetical protein
VHALHVQRGHADYYLVLSRRVHYLLTVKVTNPACLPTRPQVSDTPGTGPPGVPGGPGSRGDVVECEGSRQSLEKGFSQQAPTEGNPMGGVFINYRIKDEPYGAAGIFSELASRFGSEQVFRDSDSLWPADHYPTVIREKLRSSEVVLAIIGPGWLNFTDDTGQRLLDRERDWVRDEIAEALLLGITVIPVLLHDTGPLPVEDLPRSIAKLAALQVCRIHYSTYRDDIERLTKAIMERAPRLAIPQMFEKPAGPPAAWFPSVLLRPEHQVVQFGHRDDDLVSLHNWAASSVPASAQLVYGAGGHGKTRLALQLCAELEREGWVAGFAQESAPMTGFAETSRITKPMLIVIDNAEFRVSQAEAAARMLAAHRGDQPRRLLLLSGHKDWLFRLYRNADKQVADVFRQMREVPLDLSAAPIELRRAEFRRAVACFADILGQEAPNLPEPVELTASRFGSVLALHAAALAALLDESIGADGANQDPMTRLRNHEYRFWARSAAGLDQTRLHIVAAAATLYGAETQEQARTLLGTLPQLADASQDTIDAYLDWMQKHYPGRRALSPIEPRRIGEDHLAATIAIHSDLVTAPASVATEQQIMSALIALCHTTVRHSRSRQGIEDLLAVDPDRMLLVAWNALSGCADGRPLREAMTARFSSARTDTLARLYEQVPVAGPSVVPLVAELNRAMLNRVVPNAQPTKGEPLYDFAQVCNNLSKTLSDEFSNIFATRNSMPEGESEHQIHESRLFGPEAVELIKAMLSWRDRSPPGQ